MLLQLLSLLAIFLPLAPVHASIATSIDACSIDNVKSTKALKGTVYKINEKSASLSASEQYYKSGYTTEDIVTTFTQSSNIAFQIPGGEANFYGAHFDTSHFVLQESGYFKGMLNFFFLFLPTTHTNIQQLLQLVFINSIFPMLTMVLSSHSVVLLTIVVLVNSQILM